MKRYDLQGVELDVPAAQAFRYIADPARLPEWTHAFASVQGTHAVMRTPQGEVEAELRVEAAPAQGTVDWVMTFPDGSVATAYSRIVALDAQRCAYSFVLTPPPAPLAALEGLLEEQSATLTRELAALRQLVSRG